MTDIVKEQVKKALKKATKPKVIKMVRGTQTAEVHSDEVENYKKSNWVEA